MTNDPSFQQPVNIGAHEQEQLKRQPEPIVTEDEADTKPKRSAKSKRK